MRRALVMALAVLVLGALASGASATHDPEARFAGNWTLDPDGTPGQLRLRLVPDALGDEAFGAVGVIGRRCSEPSEWYAGIFRTPTDSGRVVGCTFGSSVASGRVFSGFFQSTALGGQLGKLDIPIPGQGLFEAYASAPGGYSPVFPLPMRFASHFEDDGAKPETLLVQLKLALTARRGDVTVTMKGTFRSRVRAKPYRSHSYRLLPVGVVTMTHRHGGEAVQRGIVKRVYVDLSSDADFLKVAGSGPLTGGPVLTSPRGTCKAFVFKYTVHRGGSLHNLAWECDATEVDHSHPVHFDFLGRPRATFTSSHTLTKRD
jgi:hypothetical protein